MPCRSFRRAGRERADVMLRPDGCQRAYTVAGASIRPRQVRRAGGPYGWDVVRGSGLQPTVVAHSSAAR
jgi:hypothetical protein